MRSESTALLDGDDVDRLWQTLSQWRSRIGIWHRRRLGLRGMLLYVLAAPLLIATPVMLAFGQLEYAAVSLVAALLVVTAARLNRRGMLERLLAPERRYTRPAPVSHQWLAVPLLALAVFLLALVVIGHGFLVSLAYSAISVLGFVLAYRPGVPFATSAAPIRVDDPALRRALMLVEKKLLRVEIAAMTVGNAELEQHLRRIVERGRTVLSMLAERPSELFRARRFFAVQLDGAARVAVRYVKTHRLARSAALESSFRAVLEQIEQAFDRQRQQMLQQEAVDLDVEISLLQRQLTQHNIT
jgi:hypothetical protein